MADMDLDLRSDEFRWTIVSLLAGMVASRLTLSVSKHGWEHFMGSPPPLNPEARGTSWTDALLWGIATGIAVGIMRVIARRGAAGVWQNVLGRRMPSPKDDVQRNQA